MLTQKAIEKFYKDLDSLGLRFPGAELERATGYDKSTISGYLKRKPNNPPSENFIKLFYDKFGESLKNVARTTETPQISSQSGSQGKREDLKEGENSGDLSQQALLNMTESDKARAIAEKDRAAAELIRERNNEKIIEKLTAGDRQESSKALETILPGLQEMLIELGVRSKLWENDEQGFGVVSKRLFGSHEKSHKKDTRDGLGKAHKGH